MEATDIAVQEWTAVEEQDAAARDVLLQDGKQEIGTDWVREGLCNEVGGDVFFTVETLSAEQNRQLRKQAKAICSLCDVQAQCAIYALTTREPFGVWGGLDETDRKYLLDNDLFDTPTVEELDAKPEAA